MISYNQAKDFLDNILKLPSNWSNILNSDPKEFLRLYMVHHAKRIPFQNISMVAVDPACRKWPTEEELIQYALTGVGGCCLNLNYFTKILLQAVGIESFAIQGSHYAAPTEGTHCMVIAKLNETELYLIEVGGSLPIMEPVPMHNLPYRILTAAGFPYEFRELSDDGLVGRFHIGGGLYGGEYAGKEEQLRTSWYLTPKKYMDFEIPMDTTFTNPNGSGLLRNPLMYRYFYDNEAEKIFPELGASSEHLNFIFIFKRRVIIADAFDRKIVKTFEKYEDMTQIIKECFPTLQIHEIQAALKYFSNFEVVPTAYDQIL